VAEISSEGSSTLLSYSGSVSAPRRTDASTGCAVARWNRSEDVVASSGSTWPERSSPASSAWRSDAAATAAASG
jgi:hypothetical protein